MPSALILWGHRDQQQILALNELFWIEQKLIQNRPLGVINSDLQ
jgi:hypothetical protein